MSGSLLTTLRPRSRSKEMHTIPLAQTEWVNSITPWGLPKTPDLPVVIKL